MRIGLTGGIGCGKSTVAAVFEHLGAAVYYSDDRAKALMTESEELRSEISATFGKDAYLPSGELNKDFLRKVIFADAAGRQQMNDLVHPAVGKDFMQWAENQHTHIVLFESALLLQTASKAQMHRTIVVTAPDEIRIARMLRRDGISRETAIQRISIQLPQNEMIGQADDIIDNSGIILIIPQILTLITHYKQWQSTLNGSAPAPDGFLAAR